MTASSSIRIIHVESATSRLIKVQNDSVNVQTTDTTIRFIKVITPGIQGIPGAQGPPGTSGIVFTQSTPASTWTINHNLGFRPSVELIDTGGQEIEGDISHPSTNLTVVTLVPATAGLARLT